MDGLARHKTACVQVTKYGTVSSSDHICNVCILAHSLLQYLVVQAETTYRMLLVMLIKAEVHCYDVATNRKPT